MKRITPTRISLFTAALAALGSLATAQAGSFFSDFDSGLPGNTAVYGSATQTGSGGFNNSGCLQLTTITVGETGVFIVTSDLDSGTPALGFTASFKMTVGGAGGDGFSFNFANDLDLTGNWGSAEEGNGTGLTIEFDTYNNGGADKAPFIDVKVGGAEVATSFAPQIVTVTGNYVDVFIQLNPDRTLTVVYDGIYAYTNLDLSAYLTSSVYPFTNALFGIGGRNGSIVANKWFDNLSLVTQTNRAAFVRSFAPTGRWVQPASTIDITITNDNTTVSSGGVALQLDGATVTPMVTTASGQTVIHYAPGAAFGPYTSHSVSLVFTDNASPTPNTNTLQYSFSVPATSYVTLLTDGFEGYTAGVSPLDMNYASGPNASPNGGPGNPWFGPAPPNGRVLGTEGSASPHSGTNMIRGSAPTDLDENWVNLAYRFHDGSAYQANVMMDWWFYDPSGPGDATYKDFGAIGHYSTCPASPDYPGSGSLNTGASQIQRLSLGTFGGDTTRYQARSVGASGGDGGGGDWFNTTTTRSIGWHHARVIVGPTVGPDFSNGYDYVVYFIDDMVNPTFWHIDALTWGYNVIELNLNYGATAGYLDDVSFAVGRPPNVTAMQSGNNVILTWPGINFALQSASSVTGPYTDVPSATSGYSFDTTSSPAQFFRLRNL